MSDELWGDRLDEWLDDLLHLVAVEQALLMTDAVAELRASELGRELKQFDDTDLAHMIDEVASHLSGFIAVGPRDERYELVDPTNASLTTTAAICGGRKLAHRITADDAAARLLPVDGPIGALVYDIASDDELADSRGNQVLGVDGFVIPEWVDGYEPGRLAVAWREGYQVHFEIIDDADLDADGAAELDALTARLASATTDGIGAELSMLVFDEICENPASFNKTSPPIDELLRVSGFTDRGDWWGPADSDWETPGA